MLFSFLTKQGSLQDWRTLKAKLQFLSKEECNNLIIFKYDSLPVKRGKKIRLTCKKRKEDIRIHTELNINLFI